ncbi:MoaD/ThiS family protein [Candidatus Bipolaricaulota bacterium]|nr:MoaD/ThiS family protein [Candidatus Bipolaricaulota bacterium]
MWLIKIKFSSSFGNLVGTNEAEMELSDGATLAQVMEEALQRYLQLRRFRKYMVLSVNNRVAEVGIRVREGDVTGIMPPLGGG